MKQWDWNTTKAEQNKKEYDTHTHIHRDIYTWYKYDNANDSGSGKMCTYYRKCNKIYKWVQNVNSAIEIEIERESVCDREGAKKRKIESCEKMNE